MAAFVPAHASNLTPAVDFTVNGQDYSLTAFTVTTDPATDVTVMTGSVNTSDFSIDYSVTADSDPYLIYGFSAVDLTGAPLVISHHYSTAVTGGPWDIASASLSISAVPGFDTFGLTASSGPVADVQATGATTFDLGLGLGGNCPSLTAAGSCYAVNASSTFIEQSLSSLDVYVNFTLDGLGSSVTVNGRADLSDVPAPVGTVGANAPEPGTVTMLGGALCLLAVLLRKRTFPSTFR